MNRLAGKVSVITGGARGLGASFARAMSAEGSTCVIADIASGEAIVSEILAAGGQAEEISTDVSDETQVKDLARQVLERHGGADILVNNAALYSSLPPVHCLDIEADLWDRVMAVNVRGSFLAAKHLAPQMVARGGGRIINISSGTAYKGQPTQMAHYITSKGAVIALTRALSRELGEHGICVNTLAPGLILSDSILKNDAHLEGASASVLASRAIRRHGHPSDLVGALIFLASSDSDFVTGQTIAVDGGSINT